MAGIIVLGIGVELPREARAAGWVAVRPGWVLPSYVRARSPAVLVLGGDAFAQLRPDDVVRAVAGLRAVVLLTGDGPVAADCIAAWARETSFEFVPPRALLARIDELRSRPLRIRLEPADWLGATGGAAAERLASFVAGLDRPDVASWAAAAGLSRRGLGVAVRRTLGTTPKDARDRYVVAVCRAERAAGATWDEIADGLRFSKRAAVLRVLRRVGLRAEAMPRGRRQT